MAAHSTFWCIAIFYRVETLDSQEATKEEDPKTKDSLDIRKNNYIFVSSEKVIKFVCWLGAASWNNCSNLFALMIFVCWHII